MDNLESDILGASPLNKRLPLILCFTCLLIIALATTWTYAKYWDNLTEKLPWQTTHTTISVALLIFVSLLYFYAYRIYRQIFYLFLSIAWIGNLFYLLFGLAYPSMPSQPSVEELGIYSQFRSYSMLLALISDIPFFLAANVIKNNKLKAPLIFISFSPIIIWILIFLLFANPPLQSTIQTIFATLFATFVMSWLAFNVHEAFKGDRLNASKLFRGTFIALAMLQPTFFFVFFNETRQTIKYFMFIALGIKLLNALSLNSMLNFYYTKSISDKTVEDEHIKKRRRTEGVFDELGALAAAIEHELRTPLGVINNKLASMKDKFQNTDVIPYVNALDYQRERILEAIKIINIFRAGAEFIAEKLEIVHVANLIQRSLNEVKDSLKSSNIYFHTSDKPHQVLNNIHFELIEKTQRVFTKAHPHLLQQCFVNIIKNSVEAIDETEKKSGKLTITVDIERHIEDKVVIIFRDTGDGFRSEDLDKLTLPDFSTKRKKRANSGIGLFICQKIINIHEGSIEFNIPRDGEKGAEVKILLIREETQKEKKKKRNVTSVEI